MNSEYLQKLMGEQEWKKFVSKSIDDKNELIQYLLENEILLMVDWKGEEQDGNIGDFFKYRINILDSNTMVDFSSVYDKLQETISRNNLQTGDAVPFLLKEFQKQLKPIKQVVILLNVGNDNYYIGLARQKDLKVITTPSSDFWQFLSFGSKTGEVLYTVKCDCGSMNVWQLKRGEVLTDDVCQDCGKILVDKEGNFTLPVEKDYI